MSPPSAMPSSLSAALLRSRGLDANASEALHRRHAVLYAFARVVPVPVAAFPPEFRQEEGQAEEHQGLAVHAVAIRGPQAVPGGPRLFEVLFGGLVVGAANLACLIIVFCVNTL